MLVRRATDKILTIKTYLIKLNRTLTDSDGRMEEFASGTWKYWAGGKE